MMLMGARAVVVDVVVERESLVIRVKGAVVVVDGGRGELVLKQGFGFGSSLSLSSSRRHR